MQKSIEGKFCWDCILRWTTYFAFCPPNNGDSGKFYIFVDLLRRISSIFTFLLSTLFLYFWAVNSWNTTRPMKCSRWDLWQPQFVSNHVPRSIHFFLFYSRYVLAWDLYVVFLRTLIVIQFNSNLKSKKFNFNPIFNLNSNFNAILILVLFFFLKFFHTFVLTK